MKQEEKEMNIRQFTSFAKNPDKRKAFKNVQNLIFSHVFIRDTQNTKENMEYLKYQVEKDLREFLMADLTAEWVGLTGAGVLFKNSSLKMEVSTPNSVKDAAYLS